MRQTAFITLIAAILFAAAPLAQAADGKTVFATNCASCHGDKGQGTPGLAPALKGNAFVTGKLDDVLATVKDGRAGDQKKYKQFPVPMPAWGKQLSDADIKAVVAYISGDLQKN